MEILFFIIIFVAFFVLVIAIGGVSCENSPTNLSQEIYEDEKDPNDPPQVTHSIQPDLKVKPRRAEVEFSEGTLRVRQGSIIHEFTGVKKWRYGWFDRNDELIIIFVDETYLYFNLKTFKQIGPRERCRDGRYYFDPYNEPPCYGENVDIHAYNRACRPKEHYHNPDWK